MSPEKLILIAEDSDVDLQALLSAMTNAGVQNPVQIVTDGLSAIQYLLGQGIYQNRLRYPFPEIIMLDLKMPLHHGFEVLNQIGEHQLGNRLLKIVLTGHIDRRFVDRAYSLGANSFLYKPVRTADLRNLISFFPEHWTLSTPLPH